MKLTRQQWRDVFDTIVTFALPVILLLAILGTAACPILKKVLG